MRFAVFLFQPQDLLSDVHRQSGHLLLHFIHGGSLFIPDGFLGTLHKFLGFLGGFLLGIGNQFILDHLGFLQKGVPFRLGFRQDLFIVGLQLGHFRFGLFGCIQGAANAFVACHHGGQNGGPGKPSKEKQ